MRLFRRRAFFWCEFCDVLRKLPRETTQAACPLCDRPMRDLRVKRFIREV